MIWTRSLDSTMAFLWYPCQFSMVSWRFLYDEKGSVFEKTPTVIFTLGSRFLNICFGLPSLKGTFRVYQFENRFFCRKSCPWQAVRRLFSGARKKIQIGFRECISLVYSPPQRVVLLRRCFYVHDSTFQLNIANGARGHLDWDVFYQKLWATISASKKVCFDPSGLMVATVGGSRW